MLARFFIDRPVLAWVISLVIVVIGGISSALLPVAQYPLVTPPTVRVTATYAGANAQVVADTVAAPIEQQVVGVENMLYMNSASNNDGTYTLDVTFDLGTDINMAQVLLQNRVAIAQPVLPDVVKAVGVTVRKRSPDMLLIVNLYSDDVPNTGKPYYNNLYLSNYATINLMDRLTRVEGVGDVFSFGGQDYSLRIWLDPDKMQSRSLTAGDVIRVLREQNIQVAAGQVGQPPITNGTRFDFQYSMSTKGRLAEPKDFEDIVVKTGTDGAVTYLKDVAHCELGAKNLDQNLTLDGRPSVGIAIFQLPGSNALDVADRIRLLMNQEEKKFPQGMRYGIVYDSTPFVRESIGEVFHTLRDAVILVALVVLLFLQDWRSLMLPVIDVGVSLIGTFAVMKVMGFSLNNLTLFGLVLAIGIVVDDSIVVLENIERWLEKGLPVRDATIHAMSEITGPIVAITLVLSSVLLPSAFLGGITGQFFRQFALTISASMLISAINAMTMTPARATSIFAGRKHGHGHGDDGKEALPWWSFCLFGGVASVWLLTPFLGHYFGISASDDLESGEAVPGGLKATLWSWVGYVALFIPGAIPGGIIGFLVIKPVNWVLKKFFHAFNSVFDFSTRIYGRTVGWCLRLSAIMLILYVGLIGLTGYGFTLLPQGFIPTQDKGRLILMVSLPDSASLERTKDVCKKIDKIVLETPGVANIISGAGRSFVLNAMSSNLASGFIPLKPFHERRGPGLSADGIAEQLRKRFREEIPEAKINVFGVPPVDGLGTAGGFKLMVQAAGDADYGALQEQADRLAAQGNKMAHPGVEATLNPDYNPATDPPAKRYVGDPPAVVGALDSFRAKMPQLYVDVNRVKAKAMGVELTDVFDALQANMGSYYVNDFNKFGRTWQVNVQADSKFRMTAQDVRQLRIRNDRGEMVPMGSVAQVIEKPGPLQIVRYNMFPAAPINGAIAPGASTGEIQAIMEKEAEGMPRQFSVDWTELSYLQKLSGNVREFRDLQNNPYSAFVLGTLLVFFVLAGLYESWSLPLAVILIVPMVLSSALVGVILAKMDLNIFVQVGFVVLAGLAAKNAILIVEFARDRQLQGVPAFDAVVEAATVRLRPILMTSFAFTLGVFPLMISQGAGAEMRRTLGTAVFSGMIGVTFFGIYLTPVFFYVIRRRFKPAPTATSDSSPLNHRT
jgi:multidrug efflux pump